MAGFNRARAVDESFVRAQLRIPRAIQSSGDALNTRGRRVDLGLRNDRAQLVVANELSVRGEELPGPRRGLPTSSRGHAIEVPRLHFDLARAAPRGARLVHHHSKEIELSKTLFLRRGEH